MMIMTRTSEDVYTYAKQALDLIEQRKEDPNYEELKSLLIEQVNDELHDYQNSTVPNRGTSST